MLLLARGGSALFRKNGAGSVTVYLLDVIMPETDGIKLGKRIRERDKNSAVIYISSSSEYSLDAFSVRAFSYLIKPFSCEKLFSELDECLSRNEERSQKLSIKTATGTVILTLSEIIAVEYLDHRLTFHLAARSKGRRRIPQTAVRRSGGGAYANGRIPESIGKLSGKLP